MREEARARSEGPREYNRPGTKIIALAVAEATSGPPRGAKIIALGAPAFFKDASRGREDNRLSFFKDALGR